RLADDERVEAEALVEDERARGGERRHAASRAAVAVSRRSTAPHAARIVSNTLVPRSASAATSEKPRKFSTSASSRGSAATSRGRSCLLYCKTSGSCLGS